MHGIGTQEGRYSHKMSDLQGVRLAAVRAHLWLRNGEYMSHVSWSRVYRTSIVSVR